MKNTDHILSRLFALSRRDRDPLPPLPYGLETAVLAHWRAASRESTNAGAMPALRWAAGLACAIALISAGWQRDQLAVLSEGSDLQAEIADSALTSGFLYE